LLATKIIQNLWQWKYGTELVLTLSSSNQHKLIYCYHLPRRNTSIVYTELYFLFTPSPTDIMLLTFTDAILHQHSYSSQTPSSQDMVTKYSRRFATRQTRGTVKLAWPDTPLSFTHRRSPGIRINSNSHLHLAVLKTMDHTQMLVDLRMASSIIFSYHQLISSVAISNII
jgi:hypothetical protein